VRVPAAAERSTAGCGRARVNVRAAVAIALSTASFAVALALRDRVDPWVVTAGAGLAGIALSSWAGVCLHAVVPVNVRSAVRATALGLALVAGTHAGYRIAIGCVPVLEVEVQQLYASIAVDYWRLALVPLTLVVVVAEELVWRGAALELVPARYAWAGAVCLYALPQVLAGVWLLAVAAVGLGALLTAQRLRTGGLAEPAITHAVWSIAIFIVVPLA
jgi:uncharacterized protein